MNEHGVDKTVIEQVVLQAIQGINLGREPADQIPESVDGLLYGSESPLDSLGLVALLMDVEEGLLDQGLEVSLSDERAMSQKQSPFRSVPALVSYIQDVLKTASA